MKAVVPYTAFQGIVWFSRKCGAPDIRIYGFWGPERSAMRSRVQTLPVRRLWS